MLREILHQALEHRIQMPLGHGGSEIVPTAYLRPGNPRHPARIAGTVPAGTAAVGLACATETRFVPHITHLRCAVVAVAALIDATD
eukprot:scaffold323089_cov37-Tisochrysis_lutea.AAC.1